jgi:16S rRNA (uracil1498-N3)-methyltransferase
MLYYILHFYQAFLLNFTKSKAVFMSSVPRIFVPEGSIVNNNVEITGSDAFHLLKVLRLGVGDLILVCDMFRTEYDGVIESVSAEGLTVALGEGKKSSSEFAFEVTLLQGFPKGDKFDTIVQKAVELGVTTIVPVSCERCVSRPDEKSFVKKLERYNKIAVSAASQCGRGIVPKVTSQVNYAQALEAIRNSDAGFICYEGSKTLHIRDYLGGKTPKSISFLIGPEGGLSSGEVERACDMEIPLIGLGNRILRTETASGFVLSAISVLLEK